MLLLSSLLVQSLPNILYKSDFIKNTEGWEIVGNNPNYKNRLKYYKYILSKNGNIILNRYVVGQESLINVNPINNQLDDKNLWYFKHTLPPSNTNFKDAKVITFTLYNYQGDFSNLNTKNNPLIRLISYDKLIVESKPNLIPFSKTYNFNVPLVEEVMTSETKDNLKKVLANLKEIHILGDWTQGYELIGLDNLLVYS